MLTSTMILGIAVSTLFFGAGAGAYWLRRRREPPAEQKVLDSIADGLTLGQQVLAGGSDAAKVTGAVESAVVAAQKAKP